MPRRLTWIGVLAAAASALVAGAVFINPRGADAAGSAFEPSMLDTPRSSQRH